MARDSGGAHAIGLRPSLFMILSQTPCSATKKHYLGSMTKEPLPRLIPTGTCWCGCGAEIGLGSFFARGHDKVAEAALVAVKYGASIPQMLHANGFGPSHSVTAKAVNEAGWEKCSRCDYVGAPASVRNHEKKCTAPEEASK